MRRFVRLLVARRGGYSSNQSHKPGDDPKNETDQVKPGSVQPAIQSGAQQPANHRRSGKNDGKFTVACDLHKKRFAPRRFVVGWSFGYQALLL